MGFFTPDVKDLRTLYVSLLRKQLSSEKQIVKVGLPLLIERSTNPLLVAALEGHLEESKVHVTRLESILDEEKGDEDSTLCKTTAAALAETVLMLTDAGNGQIRDVMIIAAGNNVEHLEISGYGTLHALALLLGQKDEAAVLEQTLEEEKATDKKLTHFSTLVNPMAPMVS